MGQKATSTAVGARAHTAGKRTSPGALIVGDCPYLRYRAEVEAHLVERAEIAWRIAEHHVRLNCTPKRNGDNPNDPASFLQDEDAIGVALAERLGLWSAPGRRTS